MPFPFHFPRRSADVRVWTIGLPVPLPKSIGPRPIKLFRERRQNLRLQRYVVG